LLLIEVRSREMSWEFLIAEDLRIAAAGT